MRVAQALKRARLQLEAEQRARTEPIAIIGIGCRYPGAANPEQFWQLLHDGVDMIREVPKDRWGASKLYDPEPATAGRTYMRHGGFLDRCDEFDHEFFGISPREAMSMDPQHRLLVEVCWEALENAAVPADSLRETRAGVFVGICQNDYSRLELTSGDLTSINQYSGTGNLYSFAAGRVAYLLGLRGPVMAIDTACSSSLVAVHLACNALRNGEADVALAAGVHVMLSPEMCVFLSMSRALAPDGLCKTFDARADGFSRGEGCGTVVLKRLSDALAAGDRVLAVVRGSAVNHDGPGSGLTVPSAAAQVEVIRQALQNADAAPHEIDYVEAHGTGTAIGDPIELEGLAEALCEDRSPEDPLLVGSVKTNVGHLEAAAGMAGLMKIVLAMQHGEIPGHLHFQTPNPRFDWDGSPIKVAAERRPWQAGPNSTDGAVLAGLSSFGMSGVNAHLVLGSHASVESPAHPPTLNGTRLNGSSVSRVLPLSARNPEVLTRLAERFDEHLVSHPELTLDDVCWTASVGRVGLKHRLAIVARHTTELREKLAAFVAGRPVEGLFQSSDDKTTDAPVNGNGNGTSTASLARAFVRGEVVDWTAAYADTPGRRIALPTYPFQRIRHWVQTKPSEQPDVQPSPASTLQESRPSVGTLPGQRLQLPFSDEIRFQAEFTPQSPDYMQHHCVFGDCIVPAASHVAMVLAGVASAFESEGCVLEDVVFQQALVLDSSAPRTVQLLLSPGADDSHALRIVSRAGGEASDNGAAEDWTVHVSGRVTPRKVSSEIRGDNGKIRGDNGRRTAFVPKRDSQPRGGSDFYAELQKAGFDLGPPFQWAESLWSDDPQQAVCRVRTAEPTDNADAYPIHPGLLDTFFQTGTAFWETSAAGLADTEFLFVPFRIARLEFFGRPPLDQKLWSLAEASSESPGTSSTMTLTDDVGQVYVGVQDFVFRRMEQGMMPIAASASRQSTTSSVTLASTISSSSRFASTASAKSSSRLASSTESVPHAAKQGRNGGKNTELQALIESALPGQEMNLLIDAITQNVAHVLMCEPESLQPGDGLFELGLDSLTAIELSMLLEKQSGEVLSKTLAMDYPSIEAIADFMADLLGVESGSTGAGASAEADEKTQTKGSGSDPGMDIRALLIDSGNLTEQEIASQFAGSLEPESAGRSEL